MGINKYNLFFPLPHAHAQPSRVKSIFNFLVAAYQYILANILSFPPQAQKL